MYKVTLPTGAVVEVDTQEEFAIVLGMLGNKTKQTNVVVVHSDITPVAVTPVAPSGKNAFGKPLPRVVNPQPFRADQYNINQIHDVLSLLMKEKWRHSGKITQTIQEELGWSRGVTERVIRVILQNFNFLMKPNPGGNVCIRKEQIEATKQWLLDNPKETVGKVDASVYIDDNTYRIRGKEVLEAILANGESMSGVELSKIIQPIESKAFRAVYNRLILDGILQTNVVPHGMTPTLSVVDTALAEAWLAKNK